MSEPIINRDLAASKAKRKKHVAALEAENAELRERIDEREHEMHLRIRRDYDITVADSWKAENAKLLERIAELEAENTVLLHLTSHITHCENCGATWYDDGMYGSCPYCRIAELESGRMNTQQAVVEVTLEDLTSLPPCSCGNKSVIVRPYYAEYNQAVVECDVCGEYVGRAALGDAVREWKTVHAPITTEEFDAMLQRVVAESPSELLAIPGVHDAVSEHYNNTVIHRITQGRRV